MLSNEVSSKKQKLMSRLRGVSVPMITPFLPSGDLDENGFRKNIRFMIGKGIREGNGFLLALGTTGEFSNLSRGEAYEVVKIAVEECKGRVPLVIGANHSNIKDVIEFGQFVADSGADAILVRPPYYWGIPSEEMVMRHYREIAKEVSAGIVIYNRCLSNVVDLPIVTLKKLAEMDQVVALKDGTSVFSKFDRTIKELSGKISCINGWGEVYEPYTLLMGSDGFLSCPANFLPHVSMNLLSFARGGDYIQAEKIHRSLVPLLDILFSGVYGQFIELTKYAMDALGLAGGSVKDPLPRATPDQKASLIRSLKDLGGL